MTIAGAGTAYIPTAADVGHTIVGVITATNVDGSTAATTATSDPILPAVPRWKTLPSLAAADANVGSVVSVTAGTFSGPLVVSDAVALMRCTNVCVADTAASTYTIAAADTGAILRVRETATNSGGTTVVWSASYLGPVTSPASASAVLAGGPVSLRNSDGTALAVATLQSGNAESAHAVAVGATHRAARRRLTIRRAAGLRGKLRAWACAATVRSGAAPGPCTRKLTLTGIVRVSLPASLTGKVRIVVVRSR